MAYLLQDRDESKLSIRTVHDQNILQLTAITTYRLTWSVHLIEEHTGENGGLAICKRNSRHNTNISSAWSAWTARLSSPSCSVLCCYRAMHDDGHHSCFTYLTSIYTQHHRRNNTPRTAGQKNNKTRVKHRKSRTLPLLASSVLVDRLLVAPPSADDNCLLSSTCWLGELEDGDSSTDGVILSSWGSLEETTSDAEAGGLASLPSPTLGSLDVETAPSEAGPAATGVSGVWREKKWSMMPPKSSSAFLPKLVSWTISKSKHPGESQVGQHKTDMNEMHR